VAAFETDIEAFARLAAALANAADREALLAEHGLDEERWESVESAWYERLAAAEEGQRDEDGPPPILVAWAEAWARAHHERGTVLPFERYVEISKALAHGRDVAGMLARFGIDLAVYLASHQHWAQQMARDPALAHRFRRG
jgi:hypothetical protein